MHHMDLQLQLHWIWRKFPIKRLDLHGDRLRLVDKPMYRNVSSSLLSEKHHNSISV
jgi:hypothetical protein